MKIMAIGDIHKVAETIRVENPHVRAQFENIDKPELDDYLEDLDINMHNQARLNGVGGSNRPPFNTPSEFTEQQLNSFLKNNHAQAMDHLQLPGPIEKSEIPLMVIPHTPPADTTIDRLNSGSHVGSSAVCKFIEQQPQLCIPDHIHEARGFDNIGTTPVYNPGKIRDVDWLEIHLNRTRIKTKLHD